VLLPLIHRDRFAMLVNTGRRYMALLTAGSAAASRQHFGRHAISPPQGIEEPSNTESLIFTGLEHARIVHRACLKRKRTVNCG